jgi:hypothetical protein
VAYLRLLRTLARGWGPKIKTGHWCDHADAIAGRSRAGIVAFVCVVPWLQSDLHGIVDSISLPPVELMFNLGQQSPARRESRIL